MEEKNVVKFKKEEFAMKEFIKTSLEEEKSAELR